MQTFRFLAPLVMAGCAAFAPAAQAIAVQTQVSAGNSQPPPARAGARQNDRVAAGPATAGKRSETAKQQAWAELTPAQQQALAPLAGTWASLSAAQKRKWLALARRYPRLPAEEQATLHSRMRDWVALSPQQRTQARLNFGETKTLSPDDKKAKWEAYQALSPEEKRKLAAGAAAKPPATAAAVKPVPPQKLATVPKPRKDAKTPRIATGPAAEASGSPNGPAAGPN